MANPDMKTALWGKICVHNKLITQQQWDEVVAHVAKSGEGIEQALQSKGFVKPQHIEIIKKKVQEVIDKQASSPASAPAPAPAPAAKEPNIEYIPPAAAKSSAPAPAAPKPAAPAPAPAPAVSKIQKPTSGGLGERVAGDTGQAAPAAPANSKIIKSAGELLPSLRQNKLQSPIPYVPPPEDAAARIESPVAPNQLDPFAVKFIKDAIKAGASDMHFSSGSPPFYRLHGRLVMSTLPSITAEQGQKIVLGFMDDKQQQHFLRHHDLDFSFDDPNIGRFRANALEQFRGTDIIFRYIPPRIPTLAELGLPDSIAKLTEYHQGLVLVTGSAGCGKSTTAAALIDLVNSSRKDHIITVEDPVEYLHKSKGCNVTMRQVPNHTASFAAALKGALREDPDVIMIGDMRDLETVSLAIRAAETGHLVIGTLQTKSAARTVDRVVDVFPSDQQGQIRTMLSESLRGIITQQLVPRADGNGRVVALEVLYVNTAVANLIRDSKTFQLPSLMQVGKRQGQKLMDHSLLELMQAGIITKETAIRYADNIKAMTKDTN
jgi:twitching motility protein PilT